MREEGGEKRERKKKRETEGYREEDRTLQPSIIGSYSSSADITL